MLTPQEDPNDAGRAFCEALGYESQFHAYKPGCSILRGVSGTYEQVRATLRGMPCAVEGWEDTPDNAFRVRLDNGGSLLLVKDSTLDESFLWFYPGGEPLHKYRDIVASYSAGEIIAPLEKLSAWADSPENDGSK